LKKKKQVVVATKKLRKYRIDKRIPRRTLTTIRVDKGSVEEVLQISYPHSAEVTSHEIPKEKNPNLITINFGNIKVCWYLNEEKGFVYTLDGNFAGSFKRHDLKNAFYEFGVLLKEIKQN